MLLLQRIQKVLGQESERAALSIWPAGFLALLGILAIGTYFSVEDATAQDKRDLNTPSPEIRNGEGDWSYYGNRKPKRIASKNPPSEFNRITLPKYRIAPPDVLVLQSERWAPKDHTISYGDTFEIIVSNALEKAPISGHFAIDKDGYLNIRPHYGSVKLYGVKVEDCKTKLEQHLKKYINEPKVKIELLQASGFKQIFGEHLVGPDGTINLGTYGTTYVAGKTTAEAQAAIEKHLSQYVDTPKVSVDVLQYNSKFFYVITQGTKFGDQIVRIPITGNETVLDALAQAGGLTSISSKKIWVARPAPKGELEDQILPVDYDAITRGAKTATNYQVLPGDRIFIQESTTPGSFDLISDQVEAFNRLVEENKAQDAIQLARRLFLRHRNNAPVRLMMTHAIQLQEQLIGDLKSKKIVTCYGVSDLVKPKKNTTSLHHSAKQVTEAEFEPLIKLIKSTVVPSIWEEEKRSYYPTLPRESYRW